VQLKVLLPHKEDVNFVLDAVPEIVSKESISDAHGIVMKHRRRWWCIRLQIRLGWSKEGLWDAMQLSDESLMNCSVEIDDQIKCIAQVSRTPSARSEAAVPAADSGESGQGEGEESRSDPTRNRQRTKKLSGGS
jgi:hypothetical protein